MAGAPRIRKDDGTVKVFPDDFPVSKPVSLAERKHRQKPRKSVPDGSAWGYGDCKTDGCVRVAEKSGYCQACMAQAEAVKRLGEENEYASKVIAAQQNPTCCKAGGFLLLVQGKQGGVYIRAYPCSFLLPGEVVVQEWAIVGGKWEQVI